MLLARRAARLPLDASRQRRRWPARSLTGDRRRRAPAHGRGADLRARRTARRRRYVPADPRPGADLAGPRPARGRAPSSSAIPTAIIFLNEARTGRNLFAAFGGVPSLTDMREGKLRCSGAFGNSILAGCFWASLIPLMAARGFQPGANRALAGRRRRAARWSWWSPAPRARRSWASCSARSARRSTRGASRCAGCAGDRADPGDAAPRDEGAGLALDLAYRPGRRLDRLPPLQPDRQVHPQLRRVVAAGHESTRALGVGPRRTSRTSSSPRACAAAWLRFVLFIAVLDDRLQAERPHPAARAPTTAGTASTPSRSASRC